MSNQESNSKRIAKNTLLLYFRMILIMVVSLYTSRVILNELGVEDFGIYNLVAGVVVLFSFLSNAMVTATQRYLSVAIGKGDEKYIQSIFSTSLLSHFILILFIVFVAETVGLWFVNTKLEIPVDRMYATNVIYQLAIATTSVNIIRIPYNASIIANERMAFFAYISIVETFLKLLVVWVLAITPTNGDDRQSSLLEQVKLNQCRLRVNEEITHANPFYDKEQEQINLGKLRKESLDWIEANL